MPEAGVKPNGDAGVKAKPPAGMERKSESPAKPLESPKPPPVEQRRHAPPTVEDQTKARKEIAEWFRDDYVAAVRDRQGQQALAEKLYQRATQTHDDPTGAYVSYLEARDLAVAAGDVSVLENILADLGAGLPGERRGDDGRNPGQSGQTSARHVRHQ